MQLCLLVGRVGAAIKRTLVFQHFWILIMVQQNRNQKCEVLIDGGIFQNLLLPWQV